eukprot:14650-Pyramimonas_sp.AAC.1
MKLRGRVELAPRGAAERIRPVLGRHSMGNILRPGAPRSNRCPRGSISSTSAAVATMILHGWRRT